MEEDNYGIMEAYNNLRVVIVRQAAIDYRRALKRRSEIAQEMRQVEEYIDGMPEGIDKQIFEMVYLDGMTQQEVGEILSLERSGILKKINAHFKFSQLSHL